jgi:hypothetical protein
LIPNPIDTIPQAACQLLVHTLREEEVREYCKSLGGSHRIMTSIPPFEGMSNMLFSILQQLLEDPAQLKQSMETTVKLCWLRLSKQKSQKVTFKQLIEILAPLIHRNQEIFVQVMKSNIKLFRSEGHLTVALKENVDGVGGKKNDDDKKVCIYICICIYVYIYTCMYICIHICIGVITDTCCTEH